ncbi:MAG: hypothetical protein FJY86_02670 [Candidatus Diapherotrites archaeon]|uniref:Uncharacterized protein n=1 Tax=Candidatus Iainarchaeum sp. TaxID=3101447 RepID=A0A8T4C8E4_9ARCH|nr:hypothetical protein [Candidatus Diapherotrites archaeon]
MGITDTLGSAYMRVEDAYYGVLDFFEEKGFSLPWSYNDLVENKGIPALPFTIALVAILCGGIFYAATVNAPQDMAFTLNLKDNKGRALEDVFVKITDSKGKILDELTASDGQTITLKGVSPNEKLTISARKQGFGEKTSTLLAGETSTRITLQGNNDAIVGKLKLVDGETGTTITSAIVQASWSGNTIGISSTPNAEGIVLLNVPLNEEITLSVSADNYETLVDTITFSNDDVKIKELSPKASASQGKSVLIVKAIDKTTQLPLENVHIKIENAQSGEIISDVDVQSGMHSENLTKGLVVRVSVSKENYTTYTSNTEYAGGKTLRNEEEVLLAPLSFGGTSLHVVAQSETSKQPLSGVEFTLLDNANEKIDMQTSNFSGDVEFPGLNETNTYTILAFSSNFFPARKQVEWNQLPASENGRTMIYSLNPFVNGNAGTLTVFASEKDGKAATNASVEINEKINGDYLPYVGARSMDSAGSFTARIPVGTTILVRATRENAADEKEITIVSGLNKVLLTLESNTQAVTFNLKTSDGKPFIGNVTLTTSSGNELFSGAVTDGTFNTLIPNGETLTLRATNNAGNVFTKTFNVGNETQMTIVVDAAANTSDGPIVTFEGLVDTLNNPVPGISATQDVFARFSVKWPKTMATQGGLFVRVGEDAVASVDTQHEGIIGVNGDADKITYGRSWNPTPLPGKETKDRATNGKAGIFNKWVEILVDKPLGTQTFDIRLRAREHVNEESVNVYYRSFVQNTNQTIRTPADTDLGTSTFTTKKSGLYATSLSARVNVYESIPFCKGKICVTLNIVDADNRTYPIGGVQTLIGKNYALQATIQTNAGTTATNTTTEGLVSGNTTTGSTATVKISTDNENPLLSFTKNEIGTFGTFNDSGKRETSTSFNVTGTNSAAGARARVHFLPENEGDTVLNVQIISGNESFTQTIPIEIVEPNTLNVELPEHVENGKPISMRVLDAAQQTPITKALITFTDASGKFAGSVKGTNNTNKGENGTYVFDKSLSAGLYAVRVSVEKYADFEGGILVGIDNPISIEEKITLTIPFGQKTVTQNVSVNNHTNQTITNLTGEIEPIGKFPAPLVLSVGTITSLTANGKGSIPITLTYSGDAASSETIQGTAALRVHGDALLSFPVSARSTITAAYNPKLDSSCLQFSKQKISVTLQSENQPFGNAYNGNTFNENANYYGTANTPNANVYNAQGYNTYGYNANGVYQNAETKRVNVKVKNNCGETLNLVPGITQNDGQPLVDGLKIAAIDSSLQLSQGQEKQVDFEVSNQLFRAGFYAQPMQFYATFSSPQVNASLPFDVQFWDRSMAILAPENIELTLIKTGNQKASDRATIPITNIGASPIYGLTATLEGENTNDVTFKLENLPGKVNGNLSILLPGQSQYPPLSVLVESLRDDSTLASKRMIISGMIEGRKVILREVNIYARTGSSSCLNVSAFDTPVSFISSETQGSISKRITIQNKCLEPVRVTRIEAPKLGTNTLDISSTDRDATIEMNDEKEFNLTLVKSQAFKNQFSIQVVGLLQLSQKTISSNALPVLVALGSQELEFSQASNPVQVDVCEGGKITVRYPILAKKDECSQAYCDAEQASHMLAEAIEKQLAKAVQLMQAKKNDAGAFASCTNGGRSCTFSQLGITSPSFTIYLQNDILTTMMLSYVMKSGAYPRLAGMLVSGDNALNATNGESAFATHLGTGFGNAVYLPEINGCGKYDVTLLGGVEVVAGQLQSDKLSTGIILNRKENTAECQDKIYNAANFLPKNKSVGIENSQQTRLGVVEYSSNALQEPAEWLAETVFGKSSRATKNSNSNRMTLNIGNLSQSIVELTLDPLTKGAGAKNIITVVRQTQGSVQKESMVEAGKIITSLGKGVKGCITRDEQTWRIISVPDVGQFTYEGCALNGASDGGLVVRSNLTCCTLSTRSDIASDAMYTLSPSGSEPLLGMNQLDLYTVGVPVSAENTYAKPGQKITYDAAYALEFDTKKQVYGKDLLLCGSTDPRIQQQANKQTVQTIATRTLDDTRAGPLKLELRTCTVDADEALAKAYKKGNGTWYATLDWDSDTARKTIMQTIAEATQTEKLGNAYVSYLGQGILANDNPVYQAQFKDKQLTALGGYAAACAAACGVCAGVAAIGSGGFGSAFLWDCAVGCGLPAGMGLASMYSEDIQQSAQGTFLQGPANLLLSKPAELAQNTIGNGNENTPANIALGTGLTYSAVRGSIKGVKTYQETSKKVTDEFEKAKDAVKTANEKIATDKKGTAEALENAKTANDAAVKELEEKLIQIEDELRPLAEKATAAEEALNQAAAAKDTARRALEKIDLELATLPPADATKEAALLSARRATDEATRAAETAKDAYRQASDALETGIDASKQAARQVAEQKLIATNLENELKTIQKSIASVPDSATIARELGVDSISTNLNTRYSNLQKIKKEWDALAYLEKDVIKKEGAIGTKFIKGNIVTPTQGEHVFWKAVRRKGDTFVFDLEKVTTHGDVPIKDVPITELSNYGMDEIAARYRVLDPKEVTAYMTKFTDEFASLENEIASATQLFTELKARNFSPAVNNLADARLAELRTLGSKVSEAKNIVASAITSRKGIPVNYLSKKLVNNVAEGTTIIAETRVKEISEGLTAKGNDVATQAAETRGRLDILSQQLDEAEKNVDVLQTNLDTLATKSATADAAAADAAKAFDDLSKTTRSTVDELARLTNARQDARLALLEASQKYGDVEKEMQTISSKFEDIENLSAVQEDAATKLANAQKARESALAKAQAALDEANAKKTLPDAVAGSKTKGLAKSIAKGLICSGIGNLTGYGAYRAGLTNEVENKITLEAGSNAILDPQTNELVFEKGQTYQFVVTPGTGTGTSHTIRVDVVSPNTQVNPQSWLDDCSAK